VYLTLSFIFTNKNRQRHCFEHTKEIWWCYTLTCTDTVIASALGAAGGVASSVSASNNAKAAATAQAELERHNGEVEAQLKTGSGVISDYAGKTPMIGNLFKPILQKLGLANRTFQRCIHA